MNIFVLDHDPILAAQYHCDKHVVKMILETAQMMSTVHFLHGVGNVPYKPSHQNHPCVKWAATNSSNYNWLAQLGIALGKEFEFRRGKKHKSVEIIENLFVQPGSMQRSNAITPHALAMPTEYVSSNAVESYRNYYKGAKKDICKWAWGRPQPAWWK